MSLFKFLKTPIIYLRKEAISTALVKWTDAENAANTEETEGYTVKKKKRELIPVETSIQYMKSKAYKKAYGDNPVWTLYRRNFKGVYPPETRKTCIRNGVISTASPCPICRDEFLRVHFTNIDLIKQFISPYGGEILPSLKTGVCQFQYKNLLVAIKQAQNCGLIKFYIPHRYYDYSMYNKNILEQDVLDIEKYDIV